MAGEGSVLHMIKSLKSNRSLLKKRAPMTSATSGEKKPLKDHKEFTEEAKQAYYQNLKLEKSVSRKKMILAGVLTLVGLILFIAGLIYAMRMVFDF